jgi:hypothetical protein
MPHKINWRHTSGSEVKECSNARINFSRFFLDHGYDSF